MASDNSADSYLDLLRQSGLVKDDQIQALQEEFGGQHAKPDNSRELADELVKRDILTRWQADMLLKGKHRGFHLGPHRILRPLGQGGMSKVFLAEHEMMRRRCAIKVLPTKYQTDPDLLARFHIEARAIAALDHPHIVRAYDFNKHVRYGKEIHYLVMEYVDGPDLRRLVDEQGPLDFRKAADFIAQAADGLAHAHQAGFVHRDIKPANLLVDQNGVLKILDLGLARVTFEGEQPWQTATGEPSAVGTADYVAPEQVADSRNVDGRADIYSLGHTFYFLLTGRRPFPKSTLGELLMAHRREQPEPIGKFRPDVPLELIDIFERMTAKEPIRRFQTAREVADKIQSWLNESAGGEFSRISALMAAAMRSKQPAEPDAAKAGSKETEASVLELADLEDEPRPAAKSPSSESGVKPAPPVKPAAKERPSGRLQSPPGDAKRSALGDSKPTLANMRADVLAELLPADSYSASQSDPLMMLPPAEGRSYPAAPRFKHQVGPLAVLKSPWFWTALVWLVFAVLLVILLFGTSASDAPREHRPDEAANRNGSSSPGEQRVSPAATPVAPGPEQAEPPSISPGETPSPESGARPPSVESPHSPAEKPAAEPPPAEQPAPAPPAGQEAPKPADRQPRPEHPPAPPAPKKLDSNELLAGIKKLSLVIQSDQDLKNSLTLTIKRQALDAIEPLDIKIEEVDAVKPLGAGGWEKNPAEATMIIQVKVTQTADLFTVVLNGGVGFPVDGGRLAALWKQSKQVVSLPANKLRQDQVLLMLRRGAKEYFDQFADDVRKARIKVKFK